MSDPRWLLDEGKELGSGGMILLEGYDMVNQWRFAGEWTEMKRQYVLKEGGGM